MPLYVVEKGSLEVKRAYERSPVISLMTNAASGEDIPVALREASEHTILGDLSLLHGGGIPVGSDSAILWMEGSQLLEGSAPLLRRIAPSSGRRGLAPVHLPCLPEIDLIGAQPLIWNRQDQPETLIRGVQLAGPPSPPPEWLELLEESPDPWARITRAVFAEQRNPGEGTEQLARLWKDTSIIPPIYGALLVRNLIALGIRQGKLDQAENLARLGMDCYPRCAELAWMAGYLSIKQDKLRRACQYARQAVESADISFIGSGGEDSYRSQWLIGLAAELDGKQALAIQCYLMGMYRHPAFPPSVLGLLRQRVSAFNASQLYYRALSNLVHREPEYLELVLHFLLLHRQFEPARRLVNYSKMSDALRERLQNALDGERAIYRQRVRPARAKAGVMLSGPFYVHSSIARINRELGAALTSAEGLDAALEPHGMADVFGQTLPHFEAIAGGLKRRLSRLDVTVRHHWPPDFEPPACGKLVTMVHWEYGSVPKRWVEKIEANVTELWVSSKFTEDVFARSGVNPGRIRVMPPGIDTAIFRPDGPSWRPEGCRKFVFLFVGGAIPRKGADVLWNAYAKVFRFTDEVTLVIKDLGASTFYRGKSLAERIRAATRAPRSPHVIILNGEIDDEKLASLYRGSDVFVLPYRGEGFGMPLAEALACGKPVITTGLGPAREFCPPEMSHFISARVVESEDPDSEMGPTVETQTFFEPDVNELADTMRDLFERGRQPVAPGSLAVENVRTELSWDRITRLELNRIRELA